MYFALPSFWIFEWCCVALILLSYNFNIIQYQAKIAMFPALIPWGKLKIMGFNCLCTLGCIIDNNCERE